MARSPVRINTGFPSAAKTAKKLGVSKKIARDLSLLAERSLTTGEFILPGVGRLVRVHAKSRVNAANRTTRVPAKNVAKYRVVKDAITSRKKKLGRTGSVAQ
jgi:hypothetical protein